MAWLIELAPSFVFLPFSAAKRTMTEPTKSLRKKIEACLLMT
jgi:hypothetical protein